MNRLFTITALVCALGFGFTSCDKDDATPVVVEQEYDAKVKIKDGETAQLPFVSATENSEGSIKREGAVYKLRNFRQGTMNTLGTAVVTAAVTYYFDFKENDGATATNHQIKLNATQRDMDISANTTSGYTLSYIDKSLASTTSTDSFTALTSNKAGIFTSFSPTGTIGWSNYDMTVHHIIAIPDRTFILLKEGKPHFKFAVSNVYSNETPNKVTASDNYVYYAIDYQEFK